MVVKKVPMMGESVAFNVPVSKMRKVRVNLSPRQALVLRKGGAVTIKAITDKGTHELSLPEMDVKRLMTKLNKNVGGRVKLNGGGIVEDFGRYIKPLSDRAIDRGIQALDGSGIKRGRKGMGIFDFLDPKKNGANDFFKKTLPNTLIDDGIPLVTGAIGSVAGSATGNPLLGVAGSYAGKRAGQEASKRIRKAQGRGISDLAMEVGKQVAKKVAKKVISYGAKKARQGVERVEKFGSEMVGEGIMPAGVGGGILPAGVNLRRGGGINDAPIQTGVPYLQIGAPGWKPYVSSQNPFATNTLVGRQPKSGGKIVRL